MKREYIEPEVMDSLEEAVAYDKIIKMYYWWLNRPQIKVALKVIKRKFQEREEISILDVGCGTGRIPIEMAKRVPRAKIYAIDYSSNMLKVADENIKKAGLKNKIVPSKEDANRLTFESNFFDVAMCSGMLHHQGDPIQVLKEIKRVAKDDGIIVLNDPIRPPNEFILELIVNIFGLTYNKVMKKEYRDTLYSAFSVNELKETLKRAGITGFKTHVSFPHFVTFFTQG